MSAPADPTAGLAGAMALVAQGSHAYAAGRTGGTAPAWISAANEVAVEAFLQGQIAWRDIAAVIAATLDRHDGAPATDAPSVIEADAQARRVAAEELNRFAAVVSL